MLHFDPTISLGNLLTVLAVTVAVWRWSVGESRRNQKIDLVLFGDEQGGIPGLVKDVHALRDDTDALFGHMNKLGPQFALNRRYAERRLDHDRRV